MSLVNAGLADSRVRHCAQQPLRATQAKGEHKQVIFSFGGKRGLRDLMAGRVFGSWWSTRRVESDKQDCSEGVPSVKKGAAIRSGLSLLIFKSAGHLRKSGE